MMRNRGGWRIGGLYAVCMLIWFALRLPTPVLFLEDQGLGHQLAGALQVLDGAHPFLDFRSSYGPLVFYMSALGQLASGTRIAGEMLLDAAGCAVAYGLLASLIARTGIGRVATFVLWVVALAALPPMWKYYCVLSPVLALFCAMRLLERPSAGARWSLAASVAVAGLFRQDFGALTFVVAAVAVLLSCDRAGQRVKTLGWFAAQVVAVASPYLLLGAVRGELGTYLGDAVRVSMTKAVGLAKPFPAWDWVAPLWSGENRVPWLFCFFFLQPAVAAALYLGLRGRMERVERSRWLVVLSMAVLSLVQASHRSDYEHLLQAIPASFVLMGLVGAQLLRSVGGGRAALAAWGVPALFSLGLMLSLVHPPPTSARSLRAKLSYLEGREQFLDDMASLRRPHWSIDVARRIRCATAEDERILVLPFEPSLYYLSDRRFGAEQMMTAPGYYIGAANEERAIAALARQDVPLVIAAPDYAFDGRADSRLPATHPLLWAALKRDYGQVVNMVAQLPGRGAPGVPQGTMVRRVMVRRSVGQARAEEIRRCFN